MVEHDTIHHADIFELCGQLDAGSVDMILADLPYGTTACSWDTVIPFEPMWAAFKRIIKPRGAIVLTASQPFTSALVMSWPQGFRYEWIWHKTKPMGFLDAHRRPLTAHEVVLIFSRGTPPYYPQGTSSVSIKSGHPQKVKDGAVYGKVSNPNYIRTEGCFPRSVMEFDNGFGGKGHPTQKPVALFAYLIRTYTQPGELVFDPTAGSGTTAVAARNTGRHYIVGDSSAEYVGVMRERLGKPYTLPMLAFEAAAANG